MQKALLILNVAVRSGFIIIGVLILLGYLLPENTQFSQLRSMMGVIFILYGVFRLVTMFARSGSAE
jgi:hypothetical protein